MHLDKAKRLLDRFRRLKALVIGDVMLDHFIWGSVSRISPEAPVPVVDVSRDSEVPGGAGNVAANMAALGAHAYLVGLLGGDDDSAAKALTTKLRDAGVYSEYCVRTAERPTTVKTRIIAHHQQVVRFDREKKGDPSNSIQDEIREQIRILLPRIDCVIISDYAKGVVSPGLLRWLLPQLRRRKIPVTVDPKPENLHLYQGVSCVTPNLNEAMSGAGVRRLGSESDLRAMGWKILRRLNARSLLITRGERGMSLFEKGRPVHDIPTRAREVFDVTGAGDTVISTFTLTLAAGGSIREAAELSNFAAGIVVGKLGTASVSAPELLKAVRANHV